MVKVQETSVVSGFPAMSVMPPGPPWRVIVYSVENDNGAVGCRVTVRVLGE